MERFSKNDLSTQLRDQRKQRNWTQAQVADALGVTDQTVGRWERGETTPPPYYLKKLCDLFEITPEVLGISKRIEQHREPVEMSNRKEESAKNLSRHEILPIVELEGDGEEVISHAEVLAENTKQGKLDVSMPQVHYRQILMPLARKREWLKTSFHVRMLSFIGLVLLLGGGILFVARVIGTSHAKPLYSSIMVQEQYSCNPGFSDNFTHRYDSRWTRNGDSTDSAVSVNNQGLHIFIGHSDKNLWPNSATHVYNYNAPRLLQPVGGNFSIETLVYFDPQDTYQGAGLLIWQDAKHLLRLEFARAEGRGIEFDQVDDGNAFRLIHAGKSDLTSGNAPTTIEAPVKQIELRLQRDEDTVTASWRFPNSASAWHLLSSTTFPLGNLQVGLLLVDYTNSDNQSAQADFTYFHLTCIS